MYTIPVSNGELLDKISILEIKRVKIPDSDAVSKELNLLYSIAQELMITYSDLFLNLKKINSALWEVEDSLRILESKQVFGDYFIQLARSVYNLNDKRSNIKKKINTLSKSELTEEKLYGTSRG